MTETRIKQITHLAIEAHKASEIHQALSGQNIQTNPEEREKQAVAYALATAQMFETRKTLDAAISQP